MRLGAVAEREATEVTDPVPV
ncbi:hypothetical protein SPHINGO391_510087 [Sphingomonas aurantiaca]|uniref:Uncharacterized protein n=1 Tax=Sphingomonas aurantiaca TaxID=185949 RepID=A0A5E8AI62_9SPHN|nr:hypothetical protein SPHINGO391_510087 [Sphingomonas aurantiaca]